MNAHFTSPSSLYSASASLCLGAALSCSLLLDDVLEGIIGV